MDVSKKNKRRYFGLGDLIVVIVVVLSLILGVFVLFCEKTDGELVAVINVNGEAYCEIPLSNVKEPYELSVVGEKNVVLYISSDGVCFLESECPDKLCVNTRKLTRAGQSTVCLPARVSAKLVSDTAASKETIDAISG